MTLPTMPAEYGAWLSALKVSIRSARAKSARVVNSAMIEAYWTIGRSILEAQAREGWGARIIPRLSADLKIEFPEMRGFSPRNLTYMRDFAARWPDPRILQQAAAKLPWGHIQLLMDRAGPDEQEWYAHAAVEHGWSRNVLAHQIETGLHDRQGRAITNFDRTLPKAQARQATEVFKDPYILDFVSMADDIHERQLERELIGRIRDLLLELGRGFSYLGNQHRLEVGGQEFFIDLLFYHTQLHCYIVIDLKTGDFEPEFAGKMGFYLAAVDASLRTDRDDPSIGLVLCRGKNGLIVEYALQNIGRPIAVSEYHVLPPEVARSLPAPEEIADLLGEAVAPSDRNEAGSDPSWKGG